MPGTDWSLYDALSCASLAVLQAKDGNGPRARALNGGVSAPAGLR